MPLKNNNSLSPQALVPKIERLLSLSAGKIYSVHKNWDASKGSPVFTVRGKYTSRGWTEWTRGFQYGAALLQFDATGEEQFLELGRNGTVNAMVTHVSHIGVHDHGFNNISTYGNLRRLMREGKIPFDEWEKHFYELALKVSGAIQAARWTDIDGGDSQTLSHVGQSLGKGPDFARGVSTCGFIHSFNGPHSLFVDTIRSLRSLAVAHQLGHVLMAEHDERVSLLGRLIRHALCTAEYNVYYGEGRDAYDVRGRTAHESIFNVTDGNYRCPSSQQGYSSFSTWTRGLAWALLGFAEQLEFLRALPDEEIENALAEVNGGSRRRKAAEVRRVFLRAACATADFYLVNCCADGVPMWDTGAPGLVQLQEDYLSHPSDPFNGCEPVDSSAAAIAAQGFLRLGSLISERRGDALGKKYTQAGLTIAATLLEEPYLSTDPRHQGLLLHSVYHRPKGWDYVRPGQRIPNGESSMWGDYHLLELALLLLRQAKGESYLAFFDF